MRLRLITAIIILPSAILAVALGGWWLLAFYGTAMLLAAYEYYFMTRQAGYHPLWIPGLVLIAALFFNASLRPALGYDFAPLLLVVTLALPPLWELTRREHKGFLADWALTVLGVLYIGFIGSYMFALRNLENGTQLLFISLLATWLTDIFAYVGGRAWGKHPFFPDISPKKTREGAFCGIAAGTLIFGLLGWVIGMPGGLAILGGFIIALLTTAGDLTESLIKRNLGVKDSGTLIAGHGGVFDRLDSMFIPLTFAFYYCTLVLGYK